MFYFECSFCEAPTTDLDENGFCEACREVFKILTPAELEAIRNKCGFKRQTPDREFPGQAS